MTNETFTVTDNRGTTRLSRAGYKHLLRDLNTRTDRRRFRVTKTEKIVENKRTGSPLHIRIRDVEIYDTNS